MSTLPGGERAPESCHDRPFPQSFSECDSGMASTTTRSRPWLRDPGHPTRRGGTRSTVMPYRLARRRAMEKQRAGKVRWVILACHCGRCCTSVNQRKLVEQMSQLKNSRGPFALFSDNYNPKPLRGQTGWSFIFRYLWKAEAFMSSEVEDYGGNLHRRILPGECGLASVRPIPAGSIP
jgi:hypothetical protein